MSRTFNNKPLIHLPALFTFYMLEFVQLRCNSDLRKKKELRSILQVRCHVTTKHEISYSSCHCKVLYHKFPRKFWEAIYIFFLMLITTHNDNLIKFSENTVVILKFTIDFDGTPVSLWSLTVTFCQSVVSF